jgi:hypothetical protein
MISKRKRKALDGYVKQGKKLISPLNALPNMKSYGYVDDLLPELLWIGLINDHRGYVKGREVLECVVNVVKEWDVSIKNFALQSAYDQLSEEQKSEILDAWKSAKLLEDIKYSIAPLVLLFDRCALRFVGPPSLVIPVPTLVERLERVVGAAADKYATPGIMLHGALLLHNLIAGRIHFSSEIEVPDFNAVIDRPSSDDARRAASFMRATAMAHVAFADPPKEWSAYFWNASYDLVSCETDSYE